MLDRKLQTARAATRHKHRRSTTWWLVLFSFLLGGILLLVECNWLRSRQHAKSVAWANEKVAEKITLARAHLAQQHWNDAIVQLNEASAVEETTNREEALLLLEDAKRGQAEAVLQAARTALAHQDGNGALRWLQAYLAHPQAEHLDHARLLRVDLERALSDDEALQLLSRLSEGALTVFEKEGQLAANDGLHSSETQAIFLQTLRHNLPKELRKRQSQREAERLTQQLRAVERLHRIARLRQTHAFQELTTFISQTLAESRRMPESVLQQEEELAILFQELNVNDPAEQAEIRADLTGIDGRIGPRESAQRKGSDIKRAYRRSFDFDPAESQLFDQLVDEEVDKLLKALPSP
jgi:hypothetical protein